MENNSDVKQQLNECLEVLTKILGAAKIIEIKESGE